MFISGAMEARQELLQLRHRCLKASSDVPRAYCCKCETESVKLNTRPEPVITLLIDLYAYAK